MIGELGYSPKDLIYLIIMGIIGNCNVFDMFSHENLNIPMFRMKTYKNMNKSNGSYENIANTLGIQIIKCFTNRHGFLLKFKLSNYLQQLGVSGKLWGP